ncbi:helix-turn-helix domain-containing protein [Nocardia flavorosea]|uniref:Helix-turn-helix domain-containing protein n=1 Tax=Nocardia flavorosea TaxID=53429 RepID=A0A846YU65_9NOCA|nr:helix-turn-helix transcriptional regulator [Nocardia flavorosea]NKY60802.1 helix-turn-helix domain-containing protein [Nocardia flavorosea]
MSRPVLKLRPEPFTQLMHRRGITSKTGMAQHLGVNRATLSRILNGHADPGHRFVAGFQRAFPGELLNVYFTTS